MKETMKKTIVCFFVAFLCWTQVSWAAAKEIRFRWVLSKKEAGGNLFASDAYVSSDGKELDVNRDAVLSNNDIAQISLVRDQSGFCRLVIQLTPAGREKYRKATGENIDRKLAVVIADELFAVFPVKQAENTGRISLPVASADEGERIIKCLGIASRFQSEF